MWGRTNVLEELPPSALKMEAVCSSETYLSSSPHGETTQKTNIDTWNRDYNLETNIFETLNISRNDIVTWM
jgi:hypothetical protein